MHFLIPLLVLTVSGQQPTNALDRRIEKIAASIPRDAECANPTADDMRPYTLCLAEFQFNDAVSEMDRQLTVTLAHVESTRGRKAATRLADEQVKWTKYRDRKCEKAVATSPVTQIARNKLGCQSTSTERRTACLKSLVIEK